MKNILFYGNCQVGSLINILQNNLINYNIKNILCWSDDIIDKDSFLLEIKKADIIITQPINSNYRNVDYLDTKFILNNCNKRTKVIIFPSLYFYYFDLTYKVIDNIVIHEPSDYHYNSLIECYKNKLNEEYFINNYINNPNLKSVEELNNIANESLNELYIREQLMNEYYNIHSSLKIIKSVEFIKNNYKQKLLFYSMNHPTKYLLQYICEEILKELKLNNNINYNIDPLYSNERAILYKCIQNAVEFDINDYISQLSKYKINDVQSIIKKYYDTYNEIQIK